MARTIKINGANNNSLSHMSFDFTKGIKIRK